MLSFWKPTREAIDRYLAAQQAVAHNYAEVGATRAQPPTRGYNIDRYAVHLGHGAACYERAVAAVRGLHMWDFDWLELCWPTTPIREGALLATLTRQMGVWFLNACRILYVLDEERRYGFGYGTVTGHVESGEERFLVEWRADDSVWYEILAFSRPAHWLLYLGYPYARYVQRCFGADSLQGMSRAVTLPPGGLVG